MWVGLREGPSFVHDATLRDDLLGLVAAFELAAVVPLAVQRLSVVRVRFRPVHHLIDVAILAMVP